MAKTVAQIQAEMDVAQAGIPALSTLTSPSTTAIYTLLKYLVALAMAMLYTAWDAIKAEVNQIALNQIIGTRQWYVNLALQYNGGTHVQRASCRESGTKVILKVAKQAAGVTSQLSISELNDVKNEVKTKKVVGTDIDVISQTADLISIIMSIQYTGVQATVEAAVIAALKNYLQNLTFDSNLSKSLIENEILGVTDVIDASVDELKIDYGLGYELIPGNLASPDAGYFEVGKFLGNDLITLNMYL
ncbi:MAG: hypothetical protein IPG85_09720 [Bacteroidetes bacterium]|nr:hypothetical protein [Bacteroidota bacterium]